jgi:site-specific recombinase XerD
MLNEKIIKICEQKLINLKYSKNTIKTYLNNIKVFIDSANTNNKQIISQQNQIINSIKFLYREVLNKKYDKVSFKRPKREKKLTQVIDVNFILDKLSKIENIKHRTILTLCFSVGFRVSEIVNLKIEDIDSKRMIIHIKNAKGKKDRVFLYHKMY